MSGHLRRRSFAITITLGLFAGLLPQAAAAAAPALTATSVASGLSIPWDVALAPDGTMLVTERAGRVRVYAGGVANAPLLQTITIPDVRAVGESGLMGIAVDVDFASNRHVYICASRQYGGNPWWNEVLRYTVAPNHLWHSPVILLTGMAANTIHDGCALEMDRFGKLWVTMGDAINSSWSQNRASLNGKVLRINRDGSIPSDNPVIAGTRNAVYSMGHRNPQGIAFRPGTDQVYVVEHGPEPNHGDDEINLIQAGGNYGWPCYTGNGRPYQTSGCGPAGNYLAPRWSSGAGVTLATSGASFVNGPQWGDYNGMLWVSTLKE
nr:PQQ-dependent sugar dehydrogenase [Chloroflexota bacterium]